MNYTILTWAIVHYIVHKRRKAANIQINMENIKQNVNIEALLITGMFYQR